MEYNGFQYLENLLRTYNPEKAKEISALWLEYEKGETPEAQWVREMDKFECLVQAHEYEQRTFGEKDLDEFQGLSAKIHSKKYASGRDSYLRKGKSTLPSGKGGCVSFLSLVCDICDILNVGLFSLTITRGPSLRKGR
jgi:hypothetical protein